MFDIIKRQEYFIIMEAFTYTIQIESGEDSGYIVSVPALPGCFTQGRTYSEAVENAEEAIIGFIEALHKAGQPIPRETKLPKKLAVGIRVSTARSRLLAV